MSHPAELVAEIANELDLWPGVRIERRSDGVALVRHLEHDELIEHGDAEPAADSTPESEMVIHNIEGPSDVTAVLELFDRRYREVRGERYPDSTEGPA